MTEPKKFENPWVNAEKHGDCHKLNAIVPSSVFLALKSIRLEHGTIQTTVNILIEKLLAELKERNITTYGDRERFEDFVANCSILAEGDCQCQRTTPGPQPTEPQRSSDGGTMSTACLPDDGQRTSPVHSGCEYITNVIADVPCSTTNRVGKAGRKRQSKRKTSAQVEGHA